MDDIIFGDDTTDFYVEASSSTQLPEFSAAKARQEFLGGMEEKKQLPTLEKTLGYMRRWVDPGFEQSYNQAVLPLYHLEPGKKPTRLDIMDGTVSLGNSDQKIYNIGTEHDRNPHSKQNQLVREKVLKYLQDVPPEKQEFILEGFNMPEGEELPKEVTDQLQQLPGETEEQTYERVVGRFGEQGIGLFYGTQSGSLINLHAEIPATGEIAGMKHAGLTEQQIAAHIFAKFIDYNRQGEAFEEGAKLTQEQVTRALASVIRVTGWNRDNLPTITTTEDAQIQKEVIATSLNDLNSVMQQDIGQDVLSQDYEPQFRQVNDLAGLRKRSPIADKIFTVGNDTRNEYVVSQVYESVSKGKSPILLFGDSHTFALDPAFKHLATPQAG